MRKLLFIPLLFFSVGLFGQQLQPGIVASAMDTGPPSGVDSANWEQGYKDYYYFVADVYRPGIDTADLQNDLYYSLDTADILDSTDVFYVLANKSSQASLINMIDPDAGFNLSEVGGDLTFTPYEGYQNTATSYLGSSYNNSSNAIHTTLNSSSIFIYSRTNDQATQGYDAGSGSDFSLGASWDDGTAATRINASTLLVSAVANSLGFFVGTRTASDATELYKGGSLVTSSSAASTSTVDADMRWLLRGTSSYSLRQLSLCGVAAGLTDEEQLVFNIIVEIYMDAIGKGVQ